MTAAKPEARGREAVRSALLEAAAQLFAERGASAVSVREIAHPGRRESRPRAPPLRLQGGPAP